MSFKQSIALSATALMVGGTALASAGSAWAANDPPWTMPDVVGLTLQKAEDAVVAVTGDQGMDFRTKSAIVNQEQLNKTNWIVCYQSPKPDEQISLKSKRVQFYVRRPNHKSCWS